jgi:methionyl-tRNA formyltransferase
MKDRDYSDLFANTWKPDVIFIVGCRILIPPAIYKIPSEGTLAVHDSLLPEYRGFAPLNWAIINGERITGVTLFYLDENIDEGDVLIQKEVSISENEGAPELYKKICKATVKTVIDGYDLIKTKKANPVTQQDREGTYTCSRNPHDGLIDWNQSTKDIYNLIRALENPFPGAFTYYLDKKLIIWQAKPVENPKKYVGRIPGRIVSINNNDTVDVLTGNGLLRISLVQYADGEPVLPSKIIKSVRSSLGISTPDLIQRIETLEKEIAEYKKQLGK